MHHRMYAFYSSWSFFAADSSSKWKIIIGSFDLITIPSLNLYISHRGSHFLIFEFIPSIFQHFHSGARNIHKRLKQGSWWRISIARNVHSNSEPDEIFVALYLFNYRSTGLQALHWFTVLVWKSSGSQKRPLFRSIWPSISLNRVNVNPVCNRFDVVVASISISQNASHIICDTVLDHFVERVSKDGVSSNKPSWTLAHFRTWACSHLQKV